ncbi:CD151 antigen-like [Liolophura sinensis]|uniref:CD151 antigen-like n=1 Tax=Liolophura sinensis TaxID=3198878 RepID=UPI003158327F
MGMEGCGKFMKWSLFGFNCLVLVSGCLLLVIGIITRVNQTGLSQISAVIGNHLYSTSSIILIVCGCVVVSFFGCCGAIKEVRCMLAAFFILLLLIFVGLIIGGILAYAFRNDLEKYAKQNMYKTLNTSYGMPDQGTTTEAWNSIQQLFSCCGVEGNINSSTSWAYYKLNTEWFKQQKETPQYVPNSCCKSQEKYEKNRCVGLEDPHLAPNWGPPVSKQHFNEQLHTHGCFTKLIVLSRTMP